MWLWRPASSIVAIYEKDLFKLIGAQPKPHIHNHLRAKGTSRHHYLKAYGISVGIWKQLKSHCHHHKLHKKTFQKLFDIELQRQFPVCRFDTLQQRYICIAAKHGDQCCHFTTNRIASSIHLKYIKSKEVISFIYYTKLTSHLGKRL